MASDPADHIWLDADAGPVVRPYAMTAGRTRPATGEFDPVTIVVATGTAPDEAPFLPQPEQSATLTFLRRPTTVAEVVLHLRLPFCVVRVLLGDLLHHGLIAQCEPAAMNHYQVLRALRDGLQGL